MNRILESKERCNNQKNNNNNQINFKTYELKEVLNK